ncbi:hypothetical protein Fleli_0257 [Bernardetia litoralis DSM 6794]|uniref:Uncharacterized protein n=1 Tax=Bernardetia litoralis (strain ATCC 23117 / DSM 6794 / NBRC 15988 / NCIMB 1366 / Fx l1 / Sio-4) TaxID=880071 RepID=I4AFL1_BERLS|nr:hypothetical protein [Bernardetia litoralis]AFM02746.1 hypothetical protein Fleli_0257 [Bernardetia litoralis DSM 6794]
MKNIILILLLAISFQSFGQNNYRIEKCIWNYSKPSEYISRVDNFEKDVKTGEEYIKKQKEDGVTVSTDDKILFSIAKTDSLQMNIVLASYKDNGNIERFTLKGYAEKLGEYFKVNPKNDDPKIIVTVNVNELLIDETKFYLIRKTINYTEQNYSYSSDYYVSEIQGKEFSIAVVYDNDADKLKIEKSILESTFE